MQPHDEAKGTNLIFKERSDGRKTMMIAEDCEDFT